MARPLAFDPDRAMQEAMQTFWERGYAGTSISDLLSEMKLNRGSLYGTFGDKHQLFLAALEKYDEQAFEALKAAFAGPELAREKIRNWFFAFARTVIGDEGRRGCLMCKAAMELAAHDPETAAWLSRVVARNHRLLADVVERGQEEGSIVADIDPLVTSRLLFTTAMGLRMLGTASPGEAEVFGVIEMSLKVLDRGGIVGQKN